MPSGKTNLRASQIVEMREWFAQGRSLRWIALAYGCSDRTVAALVGVSNRRRPARHDPVVLARSYDGTRTTGERTELAARLGFPSLSALKAAVCYAKAGMRARGEVWWLPGETRQVPRRFKSVTCDGSTVSCP